MENTNAVSGQDNKIKTLKMVALILGLVGGGLNIITVFTNAYQFTLLVTRTITMASYWGDLLPVMFFVSAGAIVFSLMRMGVSQTVLGVIDVLVGIVIYSHIVGLSEKSAYISVSIGAGVYLILISAAMILASGIVCIVSDTMSKNNGTYVLSDGQRKARKIVRICFCSIAGLSVVMMIVFFVFEALESAKYKETAKAFMDASVEGNLDSIKAKTSSSVKDKDGFFEAFDTEVMGDSLMIGMGLGSSDSLGTEGRKQLDRLGQEVAKRYVSSYEIKSVDINDSDKTATVKIDAKIQRLDIGSDMNKKAEMISSDYMEENRDKVTEYFLTMSEKEAMARFVEDVMPQLVDAMIESYDKAGTKDSEITLTVAKENGDYSVTEISYDD